MKITFLASRKEDFLPRFQRDDKKEIAKLNNKLNKLTLRKKVLADLSRLIESLDKF